LGRIFISQSLDCPFRCGDELLKTELQGCKLIVCDFHAEATSEKMAFAHFVDGRASLVYGTHTHVQTADEQIFPGGLGFISDVGMCGVVDAVIGMDSEVAIKRFTTGMPHSYKLGQGKVKLNGI